MRRSGFVCLLLPAILAAQPNPQQQSGTIHGRVVDAADERPVTGAVVTFNGGARGRAVAVQRRGVLSGPNGEFVIRDLDPGVYGLSADKDGYSRRPGFSAESTLPVLDVRPGETVRDVMIRLERNAVITGRVLDEYGEPAPYVEIRALHEAEVNGERQLAPAGGATTDDRGEYRLFYVEPGEYYVSATARQRVSSNVVVEDAPAYPPQFYPGVADSAQATPITLQSGEARSGIDFRLSSATSYRVSGRVEGGPIGRMRAPRVAVRLMPNNPEMLSLSRGVNQSVGRSGEFALSGVVPGDYILMAMAGVGDRPLTGYQTVTVGNSDIEDITVRLLPPVNVPISVSVEGDDPSAVEPARTRVSLTSPDRVPLNSSNAVALRGDQPAEISNVVPGEYQLQVTLGSRDAYLKSARQGERDVLADGVLVAEGGAEPIELVVSPFSARISGTVRGECPIGRCIVALIPDEVHRDRQNLYKRVPIQPDGSFQVRGVAPGSYSVLATTMALPRQPDADTLETYEDGLVSVELAENEQQFLELDLVQPTQQ